LHTASEFLSSPFSKTTTSRIAAFADCFETEVNAVFSSAGRLHVGIHTVISGCAMDAGAAAGDILSAAMSRGDGIASGDSIPAIKVV
jgi:hypothetical protein